MSRTLSPSSGKPYGLARVCRVWRSARASIYRHRHPEPTRQRPGPAGPMPDAALLKRIRGVLSDSPFHGEGHRKVWARLWCAGSLDRAIEHPDGVSDFAPLAVG